jgi:hypothetical protein
MTGVSTANVTGGNTGRVRFTLKYDPSGNGTSVTDLGQGLSNGNTSVPIAYTKYEAFVGPLLHLPVRFQRLEYYDDTNGNNTWKTLGPSPSDLQSIMGVANTYLYQAGIELVLDSNTTAGSPITGDFVSANYSVNSTLSIYDVKIANTTLTGSYLITDNYFKLHSGLPAGLNTLPKGTIGYNNAELFLANNYDPNVMQIAILGVCGQSPNSEIVESPSNTQGTLGNTYISAATIVSGNQSSLDYIISIWDDDPLDEAHNMNHFINPGNFSASLFSNITHSNLYGVGLFLSSPYSVSNINFLGQILAHETGHVLSLNHNPNPDGLGEIRDSNGHSVFDAGKSLMRGDTPLNLGNQTQAIPEDINLHEALIMRNHALLSP